MAGRKEKFDPTPENLAKLSESLRLADVERLLHLVLQRVSHDYCTSYKVSVNCQGVSSNMTTTGPGYLKATKTSMRNLRGDFIKENM